MHTVPLSLPIEGTVLCVVLGLAVQRLMLLADSLDMSQTVKGKHPPTSARAPYTHCLVNMASTAHICSPDTYGTQGIYIYIILYIYMY